MKTSVEEDIANTNPFFMTKMDAVVGTKSQGEQHGKASTLNKAQFEIPLGGWGKTNSSQSSLLRTCRTH
jgi:hypothetical protein